MFETLDELLYRKNQKFICIDGWPEPSPPKHVIQIEHLVSQPTTGEVLQNIKNKLGETSELVLFYSKFGSLRLYSQVDTDESAFYIAEPDEWYELKEGFEGWIDNLDENEKKELLPNWISDYIVIGEIPKSGNYFLVPLTGHTLGSIYEFKHDGFEFLKRGNCFSDFIKKLTIVNSELIVEINGHTRYQDSRPGSQWLVEEYEFG